MTTYTAITNALVAVGAKPFATTIEALRNNPIAIAESDPTAPLVAAGWHPYNKSFNNGTETGRIWSFAVDGAVATVTTPDFADGWDYAFLFDRINASAGTSNAFRINLYRETSAAYAGAASLGVDNGAGGNPITGFLEFRDLRLVRATHFGTGTAVSLAAGDAAFAFGGLTQIGAGARHATAQKILRAQFSFTTNNIAGTDAAMYMLRRRNVAA